MAKKSGLNGKAYISEDSGSTWVEIGNLTNVNIEETTDMQDSSDNQAGTRSFLPGLSAWTATLDGFYDAGNAGQDDVKTALNGKTLVDFQFFDEAGTGNISWTGQGYISTRTLNLVNLDGPIATNLTVTGSGALTQGTQS